MRAFFLKTAVIDAKFKQYGNFALFKESLKYFATYAAKKSLLSSKSFTGRSSYCIALELLRIFISFGYVSLLLNLPNPPNPPNPPSLSHPPSPCPHTHPRFKDSHNTINMENLYEVFNRSLEVGTFPSSMK